MYLMKDKYGKIIYVGKAVHLRRRVSSYFHKFDSLAIRTQALVEEINDLSVIIVANEVEALILERSLIKHHRPKFNVLLRDDKEYPLIRVDLSEPWPRLAKVRQRKADNAIYLGPFVQVSYLKSALAAVESIFPFVRCSEYEFKHAKRPCNYYHMKQCMAPCSLPVQREDYLEMVGDALRVLKGDYMAASKSIESKMHSASRNLNYEQAALYRDQLQALSKLRSKQSMVIHEQKEADVIGLAFEGNWVAIFVMILRDYHIVSQDHFEFKAPVQSKKQVLGSFILQYYENRTPPSHLWLPFSLKGVRQLAAVIGIDPDCLAVPNGETAASLLKTCARNARFNLENLVAKEQKHQLTLEALQQFFGLDHPPSVIECIDISHIQGTATVASLVRFLNGKPDKSRYRKYNLEDEAEHPDDYAAIAHVMRRRLKRGIEEGGLPDVLMIDGGKGQLSTAVSVLQDFPSVSVMVISLAKRRGKGNAQGSSYNRDYERIFFPNRATALRLSPGTIPYRVLTHLRDEAHRFAITHHRKRRQKVRYVSQLEKIKGVGPTIRKRLFADLGDIESIKNATTEELVRVQGVTEEVAIRIVEFFRGEKTC